MIPIEKREIDDREFCDRIRLVQNGNHTLNHEEDPRTIWAIMEDGLRKMKSLDLRSIVQGKK